MTQAEIILIGSNGRMGIAIKKVVKSAANISIVQEIDQENAEHFFAEEKSAKGVLVDFSSPLGFRAALQFAVKNGLPFISGTTGLDEEDLKALNEASAQIPVLLGSNMSLGVTMLRHLASITAAALPNFEVELAEIHHHHKRDSPSGTAVSLAHAVTFARGLEAKEGVITSRSGMVGPRKKNEIGVFGLRGGDVVGEHTLYFFGEGERLELIHRATDRAIFARGAMRAAIWIQNKSAGRYTIENVLGL